jgi:hypothetical protein
MSKLKLKDAHIEYSKGKGINNVGKFEKRLEKFINEQIDIKKKEIEQIEYDLSEHKVDSAEDLNELLIKSVSDYDLTSRSARTSAAEDYTEKACIFMSEIENFTETKNKEKAEIERQILRLESLLEKLCNLEAIPE